MYDAKQQLHRALKTALAQYAETMGEGFPIMPILDVVNDPEFWAIAEVRGDAFHIQVSTGTSDCTAELWIAALADEDFCTSFGQAVGTDAETMVQISLVWLMLHELHHAQMGHFENLSLSRPSKTAGAGGFAVVERVAKQAEQSKPFTAELNLIFEMEADHDATEMLLDAYSSNQWGSLRIRVAAISAVMMLIERSGSSNGTTGMTHPKAATRMFQLLGHVIDMPMVAAQFDYDPKSTLTKLPSKDELDQFSKQVVLPAFFDAVSLSKIAAVQSITNDLGSATGFFHDVQIAKLRRDTDLNEFVTAGAQQWETLIQLKTKI